MKNKVIMKVLLAVFSGVVLFSAHAKDLVLAEVHPTGHVIVKSEEFFANRLRALTGGELNVQVKHSAQLGTEDLSWKNVREGTLDMARINFTPMANDVPAAKLMNLPYLFRSRGHMWNVLDGEFGARIKSEAEKAGVVVLAYYDNGVRSFYLTKKHIHSRSDFSGQRIRIQNSPVFKDMITLLGGTPVVVGYEKVIDAFKSGEIDGAENNMISYYSSDHYKYAKYLSLDEHASVPDVLVMSKKVWDTLTPEQRNAVSSAAVESSGFMKKLWAEVEAQALEKLKKEGVQVLEKNQIAMSGIEAFAIKLYSKYVTNKEDLDAVLSIIMYAEH